MGPVVGRRAELDVVRQFLGDLADGPTHLVLEGPAGIGKSTLWSAAVGLAQSEGIAVLVTRPASPDAAVPWAGLSDLLGSAADDAIERLPDPQRRALEIALSRREPELGAVDELSVRLATRAAISHLAGGGLVVVAIDDLQWLDAATSAVLAFALKRIEPARVGLLSALRTSQGDPLAETNADETRDPAGQELLAAIRDHAVRRVAVGPLEEDPLRAIVRDHVGSDATRARVDDICRTSGGNPLYAIELARSGDLKSAAGLRAIVEARFEALPPVARALATAASITGPMPWADLAGLVAGSISEADLEVARRAGFLVSTGGRIAFSHPLLEAVVLDAASEPQRRRIHRAFADRWPDHEDTPRHLAAATAAPDGGIAATLDGAADRARRRGAPRVAASLYSDAARLTPPEETDARDRRDVEAGLALFAAGETVAARERLETVAARPGTTRRAEALQRLAGVIWAADGDRAGMEAFQRALPAAAGDPAIEGDIHDNLAWLVCWAGDMPKAYEHVLTAREIAERLGDPALLARALDKYGQIEFQIGRGSGLEHAARAIEFEASIGPAGDAALNRLVIMMWSDRLDEARDRLTEDLARARAEDNVRYRQDLLNVLGIVEYRAGNWGAAREHLDEARNYAEEAGFGTASIRRTSALLDLAEGRPDQALATADATLQTARADGDAWAVIRNLAIAGGAHLARGDVAAAADALDEAWVLCQTIGIEEPGIFRVGADAVEALVAAGRLDRAEEVLAAFEHQSSSVRRPWGLATAPRGRALLESARGHHETALEQAIEAIRLSETLGQPIELGRALFVGGRIERRAGRRSEARKHLSSALAVFERLGAALWAREAETELRRISGRAPSTDALTPTEESVAALVAQGLTNQEVAARLFVSVRTVETNLTRIYQKVGVRSRTELSRHVALTAERATGESEAVGAR